VGYQLSNTVGIRYTTGRGEVHSIATPISTLYQEAQGRTSRGKTTRDHVVMVTNRLSWGDVRKADCVIGTGTVCSCRIILRTLLILDPSQAIPKELLTLKSFGIDRNWNWNHIESKLIPKNPIDPTITCVSKSNAYPVFYSLMVRAASSSPASPYILTTLRYSTALLGTLVSSIDRWPSRTVRAVAMHSSSARSTSSAPCLHS
jgi:hypothetical protein